jgi:HEAT repeat protein
MPERQLDLFSATGFSPERHPEPNPRPQQPPPADLDDDALIAAIPWAGVADTHSLVAEAGQRRLVVAIPALDELCRRFVGFGLERPVPEQVAALRALALIGGAEAARTVARLIAHDVVQGPTRKVAVGVAAELESALPVETVRALLQHPDPLVRADACRCADRWPALVPLLGDLTDDPDRQVSAAASCALGRMGWRQARPALARLLRAAPSPEVIDAIVGVADEECIILLGRVARTQPGLAGPALDALEMIDHPRARRMAAAVAANREPTSGAS